MASFKVPCPSCEHQVPIKSEASIGTKVECPKCKYRFKVEEPAGGIPKDAEKTQKKKKAAAGDGKKKNKKVVAVVVGVLAVGVLAAVGIAMMGGDKRKPPGPGPGPVNPITGTPDGASPDGSSPGDKKPDDTGKKPPEKKGAPPSDKDATNLLPNDTVALFRVDVDRVRTTPATFLFDRTMLDMFRRSFGFDADLIDTYHHAFVGDARDPFGVIRLGSPVFEKDVVAGMAPTAERRTIKKKWNLYAFKSNPFATGLSNTLAFGSLFGEFYDKLPAPSVKGKAPADPAEPRVIGLCVYDSQHVLVGDFARLEAFLSGLDAKGNTKLLSVTGTPGPDQELAEEPLYLSIDPKLKRVLRGMGAETQGGPPVLYAERLTQGSYDPKLLKSDFQPVAAVLDPLLTRTHYLAASVTSFTPNGVTAAVRLVMGEPAHAFEAVRDHLVPNLPLAAWAASLFLNTPVEFRNLTTSGATPGMMGFPGMDPTLPGDPERGGGGAPVFPGMRQPPPGGTGSPDGGPGPGMGMVGVGGQPIDPTMPPPQTLPPSHIDLLLTDQVVTLVVELNWSSETYRTKIEPYVVGVGNTLKGKMAVFASEEAFHRLAATVPQFKGEPRFPAARGSKEMVNFPRGTAPRPRDISRLGLDHPPHTRVSMFAEMLPFLGREGLYRSINRDNAWFEGDNLKAGEAWVPELLVPSYPQSAWRATSPFVPDGRVLGGTNYVAIAGRGLDAAYYDPANPEHAKKVGIVGYDFGSKVADVKDGLSNTIYLMQTPPGLPQPWIAGGGATLRGLSETDPMRGLAHTYGTPDKKPGTYALMGDGSVRFVPKDIKKDVLLAMTTRAGMEDLADLESHAPRTDPPAKVDPKDVVPMPADPKEKGDAKGKDDPKAKEEEPTKEKPKDKDKPKAKDGDTAPPPVEKK